MMRTLGSMVIGSQNRAEMGQKLKSNSVGLEGTMG